MTAAHCWYPNSATNPRSTGRLHEVRGAESRKGTTKAEIYLTGFSLPSFGNINILLADHLGMRTSFISSDPRFILLSRVCLTGSNSFALQAKVFHGPTRRCWGLNPYLSSYKACAVTRKLQLFHHSTTVPFISASTEEPKKSPVGLNQSRATLV